jgi:hypothetical protein
MNRDRVGTTVFSRIAFTLTLLLLLALGPRPTQAVLQPQAELIPMSRAGLTQLPEVELSIVQANNEDVSAHVPAAGDVQASSTTITITTVITGIADAEIIQGYPTANCGDKDAWQMRSGYDTWQNPHGRIVRSLVSFGLADVPSTATVQDAELKLYVTGAYDVAGQSMTATPYRISSPWYENSVTWDGRPSSAEPYPSTSIPYASGWVTFDVTDLVQGWVEGTYPNHGIMVRGRETSPGWRAFGSRTAAIDPGTGPMWIPPLLSLTYSYEQDFRMFLVADHHTLEPGDSISSVVYVDELGGFDQTVDLTLDGLPSHTTYAFGDASIAPTGTTSLLITTTSLTPLGTYTMTVTGISTDQAHAVQGTLRVIRPDFELGVSPTSKTVGVADEAALTVYLTSTYGFTESVTLDMGGLPPNTGHSWSQNPVTPTTSALLTITTASNTPTGTFTCYVTGTSGSLVHAASFALEVSEPTFELSSPHPRQSTSPGGSAQYDVTVSKIGAFADSVSLGVSGLPVGTTYQWSQNPVTPPVDVVLTVNTTSTLSLGEYTFTITGASGPKTDAMSVTLDVISHTVYLPVVLRNQTATGGAAFHQANGTGGAVSRIALLVGVAKYRETGTVRVGDNRPRKEVNLVYSNADPLAIQGGLVDPSSIEGSSFAQEDILLLLDSQATKGAIHDAIVNRIDPLEDENTIVVISFSGHGMYAPDDDGDEDDPYDEFLVPYGIDVTQGGPLQKTIRDDELASWLDELESQKIVLLLDTCFSGGMAQSTSTTRVKSLWTYLAPQHILSPQDWQDGFAQDVQGAGRVVLMASAEDETSIESSELGQGVFTYYFAQALRSSSADTNGNGWVSATEAHAYLAPKVHDFALPEDQNPQISDGVTGEVDLAMPLTSVTSCPSW